MLYKRSRKTNAHWWVRFEVKGTEVRQSSGTDSKERAEAFEQELRNAIWDQENLGIEAHTWGDATDRWFREKLHKRSLERDRQAVRRLGISGELGDIDWAAKADGVGARERAVLRSILNACARWGWLDKAPKVEMPHEEEQDPRWITKAQFAKLCKELPSHAEAIARFAVATGLRSRNVFRLRWSDVNVELRAIRVGASEAKTGKANSYPLSADARAVLKRQRGIHPVFVFADHQGRAPVGSIKTAWLRAVRLAGLPGFRFHDLRHTWAAWHTLSGTPPIILKELGGWSSLAMVERYSALNPGHLADWADNSRTKVGTRKRRKRAKSRES